MFGRKMTISQVYVRTRKGSEVALSSLGFLLLMWFVPGLALWLPDQMTVAR